MLDQIKFGINHSLPISMDQIARPLGQYYNHYSVSMSLRPSICGQLVKMFITLEPHGKF